MNPLPDEEWQSIGGWDGYYEVSSLGRVRSVDRTVVFSDGRTRTYLGQLLADADNKRGYRYVHLTRGSERKVRVIHQLVAEVFLGHERNGHESLVRHWDGDTTNNAVTNLRIGTQGENMLDRRRHGTDPNASRARCHRGHLLSPPNIWTRIGTAGFDRRTCRACGNAHSYMRYHQIVPGRMQEISDDYYRRIMELESVA